MTKLTTRTKWMAAAALSVAFIAGCGGGGGGSTAPSTDISQSVSALLTYMNNLIAGNENGDLVDVNALTLVVDDAGEPAAF